MMVYQTQAVLTWVSILLPIIVVVKVAAFMIKTRRMKEMMPPGPPGLPLLGNVLQVGNLQWLRFTEWKSHYGNIFSLTFAGQPVVVLNDFVSVAELLDRRSSIYSNRPRFIMASEVLMGSLFLPLIPYGELWRRMRRAAHEGFSARASVTHQHLQERDSALLAFHIVRDPEHWDKHLKRSAASTMLSAVYGWLPIDESADSLVECINDVIHRMARACLPGAYLVELFPWMLYLPDWIASWKRRGRTFHEQDTKMFERLLDDVKLKMLAGTSEPCFASMLLEDEKKQSLNKKETAWLAGTMVAGGSETTAAVMSVFMLAMVLHPEVMYKAQAQIDTVVGRGRLPAFSDRGQLPYIEAMVKEVHRWRPVAPLGVSRRSTQDDWYKGYFIPKDTVIIINAWAINRDPTYFSDCDVFRPERYLDASGQLVEQLPDIHNQGHISYGSGRRICVGKDLANQALFMDFATLLWAFHIKKAVDGEGKPITPSRTACVDEGLVVRPVPFECSITPRSTDVASLIQSVSGMYMKDNAA